MTILLGTAAVMLTAAVLGFIADTRFTKVLDTFLNRTIFQLDYCKECDAYHVAGHHLKGK